MAGRIIVYDAANQWAIFKTRYACYSSLSFIVWEWLITLSFEVDIIWRKEIPRYMKLLYCTPRYLGLISLICNAIVISRVQTIDVVQHATCRWWYGFRLFASGIMHVSLEALLMVRIFALYDRRQWIAIFLGFVLGSKTIAIIILSVLTVCRATFTDACLVKRAPSTIVYISLLNVLVQTLIWTSTLYKHLRTCWEAGWQDIPLLSLVTRDGTCTFALLLFIHAISMIDAINVMSTPTFHNIIFPILVAIMALTSCRLIMNMQTFTSEEDDESEGEFQLTTLSYA